jgi:hypothetical protein
MYIVHCGIKLAVTANVSWGNENAIQEQVILFEVFIAVLRQCSHMLQQ